MASVTDGKPSSPTVRRLSAGFWFVLGNWFLIGNAIAVTLAWRFPEVARTGGSKLSADA
jgi:hypothetical protein